MPLDSCFLILADELFQLLCGLLTHVGIAMTVHVQRESDGCVPQCFGKRLGSTWLCWESVAQV